MTFSEKKRIIDIGGGLRVLQGRGNRYDESRQWIIPYLKNVDYKILDPVSDYHPDIVGDIHHLPFHDNSEDAFICIAVLEHVENPARAIQEMRRALKPGGYCLLYVPFLYYYHAETGYYKDYWRFTDDAIRFLARDFSRVEIQAVRGALGTWLYLAGLMHASWIARFAYWVDCAFGKLRSKQVSGYWIFLTK
ncbi:methyltransferase domain-containing protein [Patescibacteria group bacterium]|nr:methyltransferase domain-containing protein [Patescibacteria group bacterium]